MVVGTAGAALSFAVETDERADIAPVFVLTVTGVQLTVQCWQSTKRHSNPLE
jgi:hypothetical protein